MPDIFPTDTFPTQTPTVSVTNPTQPVVTLIRHHHNTAELNDNAVLHLQACGFKVEHVYPFDGDKLTIPQTGVTPTIVLGGGQNVTELSKFDYLHDELRWIEACLQADVPLMGVCLGAQLIAHVLGAKVSAREPAECEYGFYPVHPTAEAQDWLPQEMLFMQAHIQEFALPANAVRLAYSERYPQQAFRYGDNVYGIQFHPEVNEAIFADWLADSWSEEMVQISGAQAKSEQRLRAGKVLAAQQEWFAQALDWLFIQK